MLEVNHSAWRRVFVTLRMPAELEDATSASANVMVGLHELRIIQCLFASRPVAHRSPVTLRHTWCGLGVNDPAQV